MNIFLTTLSSISLFDVENDAQLVIIEQSDAETENPVIFSVTARF